MTDFSPFLPTTALPPPKPPAKPKGGRPPDPEATPERQLARRLGTYGAAILRDRIKVEYQNQREAWNKHISNVVTSFSIALGQQAETLKKVDE
jgi:hypothetical protein